MKYKKHLPYLGEKRDDGSIIFLGVKINRPDYEKILSEEDILGKFECIGLLLGFEIESFWEVVAVARKNNHEFLSLLDEIHEKISFSAQEGKLSPLKRESGFLGPDYSSLACYGAASEMRKQPYFNTLKFVMWAKEKSYKIPKEINGLGDVQTPLTKHESQELGRLRIEKEKWNDSIKASIELGLWLGGINYKITHFDLKEKILSKFPDIPAITINDIIWKAIPPEYKNTGGAKKQKK
jgi:hypothetical protein